MTDPKKPPVERPAAEDAPEDTPSFNQALEELEEILQRIEGEETDIDALATELKRAAELLDLARSKLRKAEVEVTQIVEGLDGGTETGDDEPEDLDDEPGEEPDAHSADESDFDDDIPF